MKTHKHQNSAEPLSNCCCAPMIQPDENGHGKCSRCKENAVPDDEADIDDRRIAACLNACAGIKTETLEEMPRMWVENRAELDVQFSQKMYAEIDRMKQQNAELLSLIKHADKIDRDGYNLPNSWFATARAALAKQNQNP